MLCDRFITRFSCNWIVIVLKGKRNRVKQAVISFRDPLAHEIVRKVTIVANRDVVMTALLPGIEMILHHVTVGTGIRIVAEIARTFSVSKSKSSNSCKYP